MHYLPPGHSPPPYAPPPAPAVCHNCHGGLYPGAASCTWCGAPVAALPPGLYAVAKKAEWLALFLSFLLPGVGQFYAGNNRNGGLFLGFYVLNIFLTAFFAIFTFGFSLLLGMPIALVLWVWSMVDAYQEAQRFNARLFYGRAY